MKIKKEILNAFRDIRSICEEGSYLGGDKAKLDAIHQIADEMYEELVDYTPTL